MMPGPLHHEAGPADEEVDRGRYLLIAQMDVPPELEAEFNEIYDTEHAPSLRGVPGVRNCWRYQLESASRDDVPKYAAIYELDSAEIAESEAFLTAARQGRWVEKMKPHTTNRIIQIYRMIWPLKDSSGVRGK